MLGPETLLDDPVGALEAPSRDQTEPPGQTGAPWQGCEPPWMWAVSGRAPNSWGGWGEGGTPARPEGDLTVVGALIAVNHLFLATACQDTDHAALLQKYCLPQFQVDMEAIGKALWCDWDKTIG